MDVVLTGFLALDPTNTEAKDGACDGPGYHWEGHWYFKGSKSRTNHFTYKVRFYTPANTQQGVDLALAHSAWGQWRQSEGPYAPGVPPAAHAVSPLQPADGRGAKPDPLDVSGDCGSSMASSAMEGSGCTGGSIKGEEPTDRGSASDPPEDDPPEAMAIDDTEEERRDGVKVDSGGEGEAEQQREQEQEDRVKAEDDAPMEEDKGTQPGEASSEEGSTAQEAGLADGEDEDTVGSIQAPPTVASAAGGDAGRGGRRPLCVSPLGTMSATGHFMVHSTVPATKIDEEFTLKMGDSISAAGQVVIEGEGTNIYGAFTLRGTLTLPLNRLILHRRYKTERKPRKPKAPKAEVAPVAAVERRASSRITFGVRKRPLFADEEDEEAASADLPVASSESCPAAKLLAIARLIRRKNMGWCFERWSKVLPHLPLGSKRSRGPKTEPRIVQGVGGGQRSGAVLGVTAGLQRSAHQFEPKFKPTPNWVHAFLDEDGEIYEGEMSDGWRQGQGVCMYPNGFLYQGSWKRGREHGRGKLLTPERKLIYEGEWVEGKMHGKGKYHFSSGSWYEGDWKEGLRHGHGTYHLPEGAGVYEGEWREDQRWGFGVLKWANGAVYEGEWARGVRQGRGQLRWHDGFIYNGQWAQNEMDGRGSCDYPDQERYEGMWKMGKKEGRGTLRFPNGAFYEGRFRDDLIDGQGTLEIKHPVEDATPGDWMIPLDIQVDVGRAHKKAGFDKEGL